jgi:hypothetical protein
LKNFEKTIVEKAEPKASSSINEERQSLFRVNQGLIDAIILEIVLEEGKIGE